MTPLSHEEIRKFFRVALPIAREISQIAGGGGRLIDGPNHYYGQTNDLGIVLGEYYGMPSGIMTPLGWLRIATDCVIDRSWVEQVEKTFGMKPYWGVEAPDGSLRPKRGPMGEFGPAWALLKDMDGNPLPEPKTEITGWFMCPSTTMFYSYKECELIESHLSLSL